MPEGPGEGRGQGEKHVAENPQVEPRAAGDEKPKAPAVLVELPLDPGFPTAPLVQLIQHHERFSAGPSAGPDLATVLPVIPTEENPRTGGLKDSSRERGLADLPRPGDKNHLPKKVFADIGLEIPLERHGHILRQTKKSCDFFCSEA